MECAICLEEGKLILFNHENKCGDILVHDSCLTEWFIKMTMNVLFVERI